MIGADHARRLANAAIEQREFQIRIQNRVVSEAEYFGRYGKEPREQDVIVIDGGRWVSFAVLEDGPRRRAAGATA